MKFKCSQGLALSGKQQRASGALPKWGLTQARENDGMQGTGLNREGNWKDTGRCWRFTAGWDLYIFNGKQLTPHCWTARTVWCAHTVLHLRYRPWEDHKHLELWRQIPKGLAKWFEGEKSIAGQRTIISVTSHTYMWSHIYIMHTQWTCETSED